MKCGGQCAPGAGYPPGSGLTRAVTVTGRPQHQHAGIGAGSRPDISHAGHHQAVIMGGRSTS